MYNGVICLDSSESENDDKVEKKSAETNLEWNTSVESKSNLTLKAVRVKLEENYGDGDNETVSYLRTRRKPASRKRIYTCSLCKKELVGMFMYSYHMKSIHRGMKSGGAQKRNHVCCLCKKQITGKSQLLKHMMSVHGTKYNPFKHGCSFRCPVCNLTLERIEFDGHLRRVHKTSLKELSPFSCSKCSRKFCRYGNLLHHENLYHKQSDTLPNAEEVNQRGNPEKETRTCSKCLKKFSTQYSLQRHELTCGLAKKATFPCSYCPAMFTLKKNVARHQLRIHFGLKADNQTGIRKKRRKGKVRRSYVNESSNAGNQNKNLKRYVSIPRKCKNPLFLFMNESLSEVELPDDRIQSKDQRSGSVNSYTPNGVKLIYADKLCCSYCPKFFASKGSKQIHEKLHTGDNAYQCKHCKAAFRLFQKHADHERKCLRMIGAIWCPFCDYQNKSRYKVESHCRSCHRVDMSNNEFLFKNILSNQEPNSDNELIQKNFSPNDAQTFDAKFLRNEIPLSDSHCSDDVTFITVEKNPKGNDVLVISDIEERDKNIWSDFIIIDDE